jgi:hypothetical protein
MHISSYQINRYRHAGLAASELLAIDDHLATCEFCRQQLRSDIHWPTAIRQLQLNLQLQPEVNHITPERRTAYAQNGLDSVARELVMSHLQSCADCTEQIQFLTTTPTDSIPTFGAVWTRLLTILDERAALVWPMPVAALLVVVAVTVADYLYLRHRAVAPRSAIPQPSSAPATPSPSASPLLPKVQLP